MASAFCFYLVLQRVLLFEAFGLVFCCSRLSGAMFQGQISRGPKDVFVDSKGNVKEFFGSGFGRFRLVFRWCLRLFASRAPRPERVLLLKAFGFVFSSSRLICDSFAACFAVRGFRACVLLFEVFGSGGPRPDFARPKRCFCGFQR